jgi:hypothetical protein
MRPRQGTPVAQPWGRKGHVLVARSARVALLAALGFCLAALPGCSQNQCPHQGDTKCQGAQALWCQPNDTDTIGGTYLDWVPSLPRPCPHYCVEAAGQVECSLTSAPVPECASDGNSCWQGNVVPCVGGFPVESYLGPDGPQCGVEAGGTCATIGEPTCAYCLAPDVVGVPDPDCAAAGATCVDNSVFQCTCGLRLAKLADCGSDGGVCVSASGSSACALSSVADSLCTSQDIPHGTTIAPPSQAQGPGWSSYCEQGQLVECFGAFQWQVTPCEKCLLGTCLDFGDAGADAVKD